MELTREFLVQKAQEYRAIAEQFRNDSLANQGAAQAMDMLIQEMDKPVEKIKDKKE